jgi:hypothetical protein
MEPATPPDRLTVAAKRHFPLLLMQSHAQIAHARAHAILHYASEDGQSIDTTAITVENHIANEIDRKPPPHAKSRGHAGDSGSEKQRKGDVRHSNCERTTSELSQLDEPGC